mgnify:CR=1 FL=1
MKNIEFINEAKEYCKGIKAARYSTTVVFLFILCSAMGKVFLGDKRYLVLAIMAIVVYCTNILTRRKHYGIVKQVKYDLKHNLVCVKEEYIENFTLDNVYEKVDKDEELRSSIAGKRYVLWGQYGDEYKILKKQHIDLKRYKKKRVKLTYLQTSRVVVGIRLLEQLEEFLPIENVNYVSEKTQTFKFRIVMSIEDNVIKLPMFTAITADNKVVHILIDVYCSNKVPYKDKNRNEAACVKFLNDQLRYLAEDIRVKEFSSNKKVNKVIRLAMEKYYPKVKVDRIDIKVDL